MAVVCPVPATTQRSGSVSSVGEIVGEIAEEPNPTMVDEPIYVAVSKDIKESKLNLIWAIQNSGGKRICILFVHVPATMIPLSKFSVYYVCVCIFIVIYYMLLYMFLLFDNFNFIDSLEWNFTLAKLTQLGLNISHTL